MKKNEINHTKATAQLNGTYTFRHIANDLKSQREERLQLSDLMEVRRTCKCVMQAHKEIPYVQVLEVKPDGSQMTVYQLWRNGSPADAQTSQDAEDRLRRVWVAAQYKMQGGYVRYTGYNEVYNDHDTAVRCLTARADKIARAVWYNESNNTGWYLDELTVM